MPLTYDPADAVTVLPEGEYNAVLEKYEEKLSKKGNQMGVLTWKVFDDASERTPFVTDYIAVPAFVWKLKKLAKSLGREQDFKDGKFQPEDFVGTSTRVFIGVDKQEGYDDKNVIESYVAKADDEQAPKFAPAGKGPVDIPFGFLIGMCLSMLSLAGIC